MEVLHDGGILNEKIKSKVHIDVKIKDRHKSIFYFLENMHLELNSSRYFTRDLTSYINKELNVYSNLINSQKYVGYYTGPQVNPNLAFNFPIEM